MVDANGKPPRRMGRAQHEPPEGETGIYCTRCGCRHFKALNSKPLPGQSKTQYKACRHCGKRILVRVEVVSDNIQTRDPDTPDDE